MVARMTKFTGVTRDSRRLLTCPECQSNTFKVVKKGASEIPRLECSNCECEMIAVTVDV